MNRENTQSTMQSEMIENSELLRCILGDEYKTINTTVEANKLSAATLFEIASKCHTDHIDKNDVSFFLSSSGCPMKSSHVVMDLVEEFDCEDNCFIKLKQKNHSVPDLDNLKYPPPKPQNCRTSEVTKK